MEMRRFRAAVLAVLASTPVVYPANARAVKLPPANGQFDYQLGGQYAPLDQVAIVVRDRLAAPVPGKYNICYVNAYQTQPSDAAWWIAHHPDLLVRKNGIYVTDPNWPGEYLLDTSTQAKRAALIEIVGPWIDQCATAGFLAVEPDNLDSYERSKGLLSERGNAAFAKLLVARAHAAGLAMAQKNTAGLVADGPSRIGFDFAIVEGCQVFSECETYINGYGSLVYEIEYDDAVKDAQGRPVDPMAFFRAACAARGDKISIIYRDRKVVPSGSPHYTYKWC